MAAASLQTVRGETTKLEAAQGKLEESGTAAAAGAKRLADSLASISRFGQLGRLALVGVRSELATVGDAATKTATRFGRAVESMRAMAMKPIRPIVERARQVGGKLRGGISEGGGGIGLAGGALGGAIVAALGVREMKSAVESTSQMVIQATAMNRVMGMNTNTALQWVAIANAHGIASRTLSMGFKTLGTQVEHATAGTKASVTAFKALGITHQQLAAHSHDLSSMLGLVADRLNAMPGGAQKTAIAAQLLGRSYQGLIPILVEGSKGMEQQRKLAAAYGITLGGNPLENLRRLHEASINLKLAQTGLQVQLAEHLAPAMLKVFDAGLRVYKVLKDSLNPAFKWIAEAAKNSAAWLGRHRDAAIALRDGLVILVGAFLFLKAASIAASIAMSITPVGLVIIAIAALAAGLVYCWQHFKTFRDVVGAVWSWLKTAASSTAHWVVNAFGNIISFFSKLPGRIGHFFSGAFNGVKGIVVDILNFILARINNVIDVLNSMHISTPFGDIGIPHINHVRLIGTGTSRKAPVTRGGIGGRGATLKAPKAAQVTHAFAHTQLSHAQDRPALVHGDIVLKVRHQELARITRRQLHEAMGG